MRSAAPLRIMASPITAASAITIPMAPGGGPEGVDHPHDRIGEGRRRPRHLGADEDAHDQGRGEEREEGVHAQEDDAAQHHRDADGENEERVPAACGLQWGLLSGVRGRLVEIPAFYDRPAVAARPALSIPRSRWLLRARASRRYPKLPTMPRDRRLPRAARPPLADPRTGFHSDRREADPRRAPAGDGPRVCSNDTMQRSRPDPHGAPHADRNRPQHPGRGVARTARGRRVDSGRTAARLRGASRGPHRHRGLPRGGGRHEPGRCSRARPGGTGRPEGRLAVRSGRDDRGPARRLVVARGRAPGAAPSLRGAHDRGGRTDAPGAAAGRSRPPGTTPPPGDPRRRPRRRAG